MHRVIKANDVPMTEVYDETKSKVRVYYLRDYVHGFCSLDTKIVGIEEYKKGTALTITEFKRLFANMVER